MSAVNTQYMALSLCYIIYYECMSPKKLQKAGHLPNATKHRMSISRQPVIKSCKTFWNMSLEFTKSKNLAKMSPAVLKICFGTHLFRSGSLKN